MRSSQASCARLFSTTTLAMSILTSVVAINVAVRADGQTVSPVVRVEEDWELVVNNPDSNSFAPQVNCVISPLANVDTLYAALELNHISQSDVEAGGMQLQAWQGEQFLDASSLPSGARLHHSDETVTWTQAMELAGGNLKFEVINGQSLTWGDFGGNGHLCVTVASTLENLNGYSTDNSVDNSGITFSANRVERLVLKRVRVFTADGQVTEDSSQRVVFQHD